MNRVCHFEPIFYMCNRVSVETKNTRFFIWISRHVGNCHWEPNISFLIFTLNSNSTIFVTVLRHLMQMLAGCWLDDDCWGTELHHGTHVVLVMFLVLAHALTNIDIMRLLRTQRSMRFGFNFNPIVILFLDFITNWTIW